MGRPRSLFWVSFFLSLFVLVGIGSALAQDRMYVPRERLEGDKGKKPPGEVKPGPEGASQYGWGAIQKTPGAKGSGSQGWSRKKPQGHEDLFKKQAGVPDDPQKPKERQGPKQPKQPKKPKVSQDFGLEKSDQSRTKKALRSAPKPSSSILSSFKMEDDDPEGMMGAPEKKKRTPRSRKSFLFQTYGIEEDEGSEDEDNEDQ